MSTWGILWRSDNLIDGKHEYCMWIDPLRPALFLTRAEARAYITDRYGYIRNRPDLQQEPHGWRMPLPVRVTVKIEVEP